MTESETWIRENLNVENGRVVVEHDTDGESDCPICGYPHNRSKESTRVSVLTEYVDTSADDVRQLAIETAKESNRGHERFFR